MKEDGPPYRARLGSGVCRGGRSMSRPTSPRPPTTLLSLHQSSSEGGKDLQKPLGLLVRERVVCLCVCVSVRVRVKVRVRVGEGTEGLSDRDVSARLRLIGRIAPGMLGHEGRAQARQADGQTGHLVCVEGHVTGSLGIRERLFARHRAMLMLEGGRDCGWPEERNKTGKKAT